jgi:18S rRNA (guanine1575-N7)-methyltransferase
VFQFYPENESQVELITSAALRNGFQGGVVVDFPNSTKAKKYLSANHFYLKQLTDC